MYGLFAVLVQKIEKKSANRVSKRHRGTLETHHIEAIDVVHVTVLPGAMHGVLVHSDLWPIEDRRLIHVIPGVQVLHGALQVNDWCVTYVGYLN